MSLKAEWVYVIIKALEAREQYCVDEDLEEKDIAKEVLNYFKNMEAVEGGDAER